MGTAFEKKWVNEKSSVGVQYRIEEPGLTKLLQWDTELISELSGISKNGHAELLHNGEARQPERV